MEQNDLQIKFNKSTWSLISNILFAKSFSFITTELSDVQVQPQVLPDGLWVVILHRTFHIPVQYSTTAQRSCRKGLEKAKPTLAHRRPRTYATQFVDEDTNGSPSRNGPRRDDPRRLACRCSTYHVTQP